MKGNFCAFLVDMMVGVTCGNDLGLSKPDDWFRQLGSSHEEAAALGLGAGAA